MALRLASWEGALCKLTIVAGLAALAGIYGVEAAQSHPSRIIFLRHGEKKNSTELCDVGRLRAQALSDQYLGKDAPSNEQLFGKGGMPDAFIAVTVHTQETATPSAESWGMKVTAFPVSPKDPNEDDDLNTQTQKAAAALNSAKYDGKIVVVVWEHKRIASESLNKDGDTFWALLGLSDIVSPAVPKKWEGANYDFFWIIDYEGSRPTFTPVQQEYTGLAGAKIPDNQWGEDVDQNRFQDFYQDCKN
jgi:hypothetical protein